jgi:hypothetical protein
MLAAQKLRWLGRGCAGVGGLGTLVMLPLAWLLLGFNPLRKGGTYGMHPEDFLSVLVGGWLLILAGVCAALLAIGLLCSFGSRLARISALVIGPAALVAGAACRVYAPSFWGVLETVLPPGTEIPAQAFAAYLTALGIANFSESRPHAFSRTTLWPTQPELLGGLLLVLAVLVNKALRPLPPTLAVSKRITESQACSDTPDLDRYCGGGLAVAFVPQDSSLLLIRNGPNEALLEKYSAVAPRRPSWSRALVDYQTADSLVVSNDGSVVLIASSNGIERFDGTTGAPMGPINACAAAGRDQPAVAISPDGTTLAIGKRDVCLLHTGSANIEADTQSLDGFTGPVRALAFAPSGARLWVHTTQEFAAWDVKTRKRVVTLDTRDVEQFALSSDGKQLVTSWHPTRGIELWDAETGASAGQVEPGAFGSGNPPHGPLAFMPGGRHIIALASYGYYVLDSVSGAASTQRNSVTAYRSVALSADGQWAGFALRGASGDPTPSFQFVPAERLQFQP